MGAAAGRRSIYTSKTLPASHISPLQASGAGAERGQAEGQHEPSRLLPSTAGSLQQSSTRSPAPAAARQGEHGGYVGFLAPCKLFFTPNPIFVYLFFNLRLGPCLLRATRHVSRSWQLRELLHLHAAVGGQGIKRPLILSPGFIKLIKYSGRAPLISFAIGERFRQEAGSCLAAAPDGAGSRFLWWHGAGGPSTCIFVCLGGRLQTPPPNKGSPGRNNYPSQPVVSGQGSMQSSGTAVPASWCCPRSAAAHTHRSGATRKKCIFPQNGLRHPSLMPPNSGQVYWDLMVSGWAVVMSSTAGALLPHQLPSSCDAILNVYVHLHALFLQTAIPASALAAEAPCSTRIACSNIW